eukprot:PhF_6_TR19681/c0_g1_i1/m.28732
MRCDVMRVQSWVCWWLQKKKFSSGGGEDDVTTIMFPIVACTHGTLLELNRAVLSHPELLREDPFGNGYLAILNPPRHFIREPPKHWVLIQQRVVTDGGDDE